MSAAQIPGTYVDFLAENRKGVLITLKRDGRPQTSNVLCHFDPDAAQVRVSVTADRAKTRNAARDPHAGRHLSSNDFWSYAHDRGGARLRHGPR